MKNKQLESIFSGEDREKRSKYISFLSYSHIINALSKYDSISNDICKDNGVEYAKKFKTLYSELNFPLCFLKDNTYNLYQYTLPHIKKIINNPHQSIIKEKKLIQKSKLKVIDQNTFKWLATKPGTTFKEKFANQEKVLSTVKRYSYNIKENQVLSSFIYKLRNYFKDKKELMTLYPKLFGDFELYNTAFNDVDKTLNKINSFFKEEFYEVIRKEHSTPNNTLIGNVDYSSVWNANQSLKRDDFLEFNIFDYYKVIMKCFMLSIMASSEYEFVDKNCLLNDLDDNYLLYKIDQSSIKEITFEYDGDFIINANVYKLVNKASSKYDLLDEESTFYVIKFELDNDIDINEDRGLRFKAIVNDNEIGAFYADLQGTKEFIGYLSDLLTLKVDLKQDFSISKIPFDFASLNSFDNRLSSNNTNIYPHVIYDGNNTYQVRNTLYFVNSENVYINTYNDYNKYTSLLRNCKSSYTKEVDSLVIYDIKDCFDEFSSKSLRSAFLTNYANSYPVWRSILAAESVSSSDFIPDLVVDLAGEEVYASVLGRKNNLFIHKGVIQWPLHLQKYSEKTFLLEYLRKYSEKYDIEFSNELENDCLASGRLSKLLTEKKGELIFLDGNQDAPEYIRIDYDESIFNTCYDELYEIIEMIEEEYKNKDLLLVIPDFIDSKDFRNSISNKELSIGKDVIKERVLKHQVTWYECLPNLSLEVIKNGYYDTIQLVDNMECENIIGKSISWPINETFTLKAGKSEYTLPLLKSYIGENNKLINASIKDPSFPLKEDVEVNLKLEYKYGNENSYILTVSPTNIQSPLFQKIIVDWKESKNIDYLDKLPEIKDIDYTFEKQEKIVEYIHKRIAKIERLYSFSQHRNKNKDDIIKDLNRLANDYQKMLASEYPFIDAVEDEIKSSEIITILDELYNQETISYEKANEGSRNKREIESRIIFLEQDIIQLTFRREFFTERKLIFPETCYGRYLVFHYDDLEVIDLAYEDLIIDYRKGGLISNFRIKYYLDRLTSGTQMDHLFFKKLYAVKNLYVYKVLEVIIAVMKEISQYEFDFETRDRQYSPKEVSFLFRYCVELLIAYLYVRDESQFEELRPNGKIAHEIITYIKIFNKRYQDAILVWPDDRLKKPRMETKYRMIYKDKPEELNRVWDEGYCLILYLSGAKEANNIIIRAADSDGD